MLGKKIAVCLLTYNHTNLIVSTIESIQKQSIYGYEIIISDDCSNDGTWKKILELSKSDERIKAIQTPENLGMAGNANFAISNTSREYIALLHHDDIYSPILLEEWALVLEKNPNTGFVFNPYEVEGSEYTYGKKLKSIVTDGRFFLEKYLFARWGCPVRGTAMIRKSSWDEVGGMKQDFGLIADVDLWMRLSQRFSVGYVNKLLIKPRHERPDYYPDIYTGKNWHWERILLLYEIHATNRLDYYDRNTIKGILKWNLFLMKLNFESFKWLTYGLIYRKWEVIQKQSESITSYDYSILNLYRSFLFFIYKIVKRVIKP